MGPKGWGWQYNLINQPAGRPSCPPRRFCPSRFLPVPFSSGTRPSGAGVLCCCDMELKVSVVLLPGLLEPADLDGRAVVVFDVLRATTSMTAALAAGVQEI